MCLDSRVRRPLLVLRHRAFPPLRRQRKSAQLWKQQARSWNQFFQMFFLSGKNSAARPVYLKQMWCDPLSGVTAPPRGSSQTYRNIWPPRPPKLPPSPPLPSPPLLLLLFFNSSPLSFFLFPLMTNTCGLFPPAAAKPRVSAAFPSELSALARWDGSEP